MESELHRQQMELLINALEPWLGQRRNSTGTGGYIGGNMFVYFSLEQVRNKDFCGPDVFIVLDAEPKIRKSWVVWEEGKGPDVVIELLSESTQGLDKTAKKEVYQNQLRVPEYYWFDPDNPDDFAGFELCNGTYKELQFDEKGRLTSLRLDGLRLGRWQGRCHGNQTTWLRWYTAEGALLPTAEERAEQEAQRAEQEAQRAEQEARRAEQEARRAEQEAQRAEHEAQRAEQEAQRALALEQKLRALGIDPDEAA